MAVDLKVSVRSEINQLKKNITQKTFELTSLKNELRRHELSTNFLELIGQGRADRELEANAM